MFNKLTQALFGTSTDGQRKAGLGFYFGGILAVALFGCIVGIALISKPSTMLGDIANGSLAAIKFVSGALILGYGMEYAGKAAQVIRGGKEPKG